MHSFFLLILTQLLMVALFAITFRSLPPEIPLYFSHAWGEMQLGSKWEIMIIPIVSISFYIVLNYYKRRAIYSREINMAKIITFMNITQMIFLTLAYVRIIFLVIW
jgi:hypothetical protein